MNEWLENIKVGDEVVLVRGGYPRYRSIEQIERLTKTQIILGGLKFRRADGWQIGGSSWSSVYLQEAKPDEVKKIKEESHRRDLLGTIENTKFLELSTNHLELIAQSIEEATE